MPWYFPWSESIKKRACRYLLQHYLGQFLQEKLTLDQLSVDLYNGTGSICDLNLDVISLNKCLEGLNVPVEIIDGFVKSITAAIPWSALTSENTVMEINGLELTLKPRESASDLGMNLDSMFSSMTTSMQLAQECLRQDAEGEMLAETAQPMEGLEMFAQTIESVLSRIKVTLVNTVIRLEHIPVNQDKVVALEVRIKRIEYFDDQANADANQAQAGMRNVYEPAAICYKNFCLIGVTLYADRFPESQRSSFLKESMISSVRTSHSSSFMSSTDLDPTESELIQIATLTGRQEMKVKVKQCDAVPGPKLEVNLHIGSIHSILSPKYVHILISLCKGFESKDTANDSMEPKTVNKPMGSFDFERVENELQKQFNETRRAQISTNMLRTDVYDETELDESFVGEGMYYSMNRSQFASSEMTSSSTSACSSGSATTSTTNTSIVYNYGTGGYQHRDALFTARRKAKPKANVQKLLDDPGAEVTRYKIKFSFFSLLLLHEDPPDTPSDGIEPGQPGYEELKKLVDAYLTKVVSIHVHGLNTALNELRPRFAQACPRDHITLLSKPITMACECKTTVAGKRKSTLCMDVSIGVLEVVETLYERNFGLRPKQSAQNFEHSELLVFHTPDNVHGLPSLQTVPCLKVKVVDYQTSGRDRPVTDVSVQMAPVFSEVDITLIDRIHSLLNPPSLNSWRRNDEISDKRVNLHCSSDLLTIHLRFPIPDLRSGNAVDKFPWWQRTIHREILILELTEFDFRTNFQGDEPTQTFEFTAVDVHALFKEGAQPIPFLRAGHGGSDSSDLVKMTLKLWPLLDTRLSEERSDSEDSADFDDSTCQMTVDPEPTPFSTAKIMHDNELVVIPGDKQEMEIFREKSISNTRLLVDIQVPNLNARLPNQKFYELLYNRINGDLLLWTPQAPSPINIPQSTSTFQSIGLELVNQAFYELDEYLPCKSGIRYESSSESEDESLGPEHILYNRDMNRVSGTNLERSKRGNTQNQICLSLNVGFGKVIIHTPVKDENGKESEDECGELLLEVGDGSLFLVNSEKRVTSISVQANRAGMYHDGQRPVSLEHPALGRATVAHTDLNATIYKSESGIPCKNNLNMPMVSVAIRVTPEQLNANTNSKEFLVAVGIYGSTLRHRMSDNRHCWFTQIVDFLDVRDFPIRGYSLPKIVTVLHCHMWSCAVDYRPLYLPYRCLVTLENFSVSSNIIAKSMISLLKFIIEGGTVSISNNCNENDVNMDRDYVCVLEVGLFELTLQTSDGRDWKVPRTDLQARNDIIHIRTCTDSCVALRDLLIYLSNFGDLAVENSTQQHLGATSEVINQNSEPEVADDRLDEVHAMMADAMQDTSSPVGMETPSKRPDSLTNHTQVFFFPDEHISQLETGIDEPVAPSILTVEYDEDDSPSVADEDDEEVYSGDEEFCIIDDPGLGIEPRDGEPTIRALTDLPLIFKDNHFAKPLGKTDLLRAPESFPNAVYRYTLKEMSLVWHLYGGEDFRQGAHPHVTMIGNKVAYGKQQQSEKYKLPWRTRGGPFRDHGTLMQIHLNKIRLQHEIYPETTIQASRQIFLVQELEIHDKLISSQMNKFLYQYTCDQMPKQSRANMFLLKNVSFRPDLHLPNTRECSLKVSIQPLRFNVDQDALMFIRMYIQGVSEKQQEPERETRGTDVTSLGDQASSPPKNQPIMGSPCLKQVPNPNHDKVKFDEFSEKDRTNSDQSQELESQNPIFFKTFIFSPDVLIRLDYHGKRVTTMGPGTTGTATGLLAGLAQLNCSEFRLKRIHHRNGLLGVDKVFLHALNEWLNDIKKNQLPSILGGVGPMHTVLQLFQGIKDLFWLPVEQYKKDGRLLRGLQRGANSFTTSTLMATLELTNRGVQSIQYVAELAYDMVSPNLTARRRKQLSGPNRRQPGDFREGVNSAYQVLKEGFADTANTIIQAAQREHDIRGVTGAVGGVLRQIPPTVVQPIILATEATSNVLGGMRNQLLPDVKREEDEKWKQDMD